MSKLYLSVILFAFHTLLSPAQISNVSNKKLGFALNSDANGEVYPIRLIPSFLYYSNKNQFEAGLGFHPFIYKDENILSGDFNYKYFSNGIENKFNMYLMVSFTYVNQSRKTYYPATYHYLFLNGGYGWADRKNIMPNSPSTVFNFGSVTKQFTASAILKLEEQGEIKTSDKISSYFIQTPKDKKRYNYSSIINAYIRKIPAQLGIYSCWA